jgi:hypothetical protein
MIEAGVIHGGRRGPRVAIAIAFGRKSDTLLQLWKEFADMRPYH